MFKITVIGLIAGAISTLAIAHDGITYRPFLRGEERRGEPVASATFIGKTWPAGDETAFSGIRIDGDTVAFVTGP